MANARNYEEYRRQVLDELGIEYVTEDITDFKRWKLKLLRSLASIFTDESTINNAISSWMDEHPEVTVVDGSITEPKFSGNLKVKTIKDYVTPEMFGAKGDGVTDDTEAVQSAIDSGKTVVLGSKTYKVTTLQLAPYTTIKGTNNSKLKSDGTLFVAKSNITYLTNVTIEGLNIEATTGIDLTNRAYENFIFKIDTVLFNCTDYCVNAEKCFEWHVCNVRLYGTYGFVGIDGPANTFMNVYEMGCINMFVNCNGTFININTSNSHNTEAVFDYTDGNYGHSLTVINSNFEDVKGIIVNSLSTNGFENIIFIGSKILNPQSADYLFVLNNARNIYMQMAGVPSGRAKFVNIKNGSTLRSFYTNNEEISFHVDGSVSNMPFQSVSRIGSRDYYTKFADIQARVLKGCNTPITEEKPMAFSLTLSTGTHLKVTSGSGVDLAIVSPFFNPIVGTKQFGVGTILTVENATGGSFNFYKATSDYSFGEASSIGNGEVKSFILQKDSTHLYWKAL